MGWFGGGAFGGGGTNESQNWTSSYSQTKTQDQRVGVEGLGGGQVIGPESSAADAPGSTAARIGDFSNLSQTITQRGNKYTTGMTGAEVTALLDQQNSLADVALGRISDFAGSALQTAATVRTGEMPDWQRYIPLALGLGAIVLMWRVKR